MSNSESSEFDISEYDSDNKYNNDFTIKNDEYKEYNNQFNNEESNIIVTESTKFDSETEIKNKKIKKNNDKIINKSILEEELKTDSFDDWDLDDKDYGYPKYGDENFQSQIYRKRERARGGGW